MFNQRLICIKSHRNRDIKVWISAPDSASPTKIVISTSNDIDDLRRLAKAKFARFASVDEADIKLVRMSDQTVLDPQSLVGACLQDGAKLSIQMAQSTAPSAATVAQKAKPTPQPRRLRSCAWCTVEATGDEDECAVCQRFIEPVKLESRNGFDVKLLIQLTHEHGNADELLCSDSLSVLRPRANSAGSPCNRHANCQCSKGPLL